MQVLLVLRSFQVVNHIPERYALLMITGVEPDSPLDKEAIEKLFEEKFKEADVEQMQLAIYNQGSKPGDGVRAFGEKRKDKSVEVIGFQEIPKEKISISGKLMEGLMGYDTTPKEIGTPITTIRRVNAKCRKHCVKLST